MATDTDLSPWLTPPQSHSLPYGVGRAFVVLFGTIAYINDLDALLYIDFRDESCSSLIRHSLLTYRHAYLIHSRFSFVSGTEAIQKSKKRTSSNT